MSNNDSMLNLSRKNRLSAEVTFLMLKGAAYAMIAVLAIWLTVAIIHWIGMALPADSKTAPDPINRSSLEIAAPLTEVV